MQNSTEKIVIEVPLRKTLSPPKIA
jgi:hypothetical protein